jgi:membrane-associated phospholipid phosphatase
MAVLSASLLPFVVAAQLAAPGQGVPGCPDTTLAAPMPVLQTPCAAPRDTLSRDSTRTAPPLFTRSDLWLAGAFMAGSAALMPLDVGITEEFSDPGLQHSTFLQHVSHGLNTVGDPGVFFASIALYGVARVSGQDRWARLGLYSTEAIAASGAVTALLKGVVGRARPSIDENDSDSFELNRGFGDNERSSFPSGHATAAFAAATVVAGETARWWPDAAPYVTPIAYGGAALVALSRIYSERHWASDVLMGAGIGTLSGLAVIHFNEAHPRNLINRVLLGASVLPDGQGGMIVGWTIPTR